MNKQEDNEHIVTDREKCAWQASKKRGGRERPELNRLQRIQFLKLVAQLATRSVFERKLGLSPADVEFYKTRMDIESGDEARRLARRLEMETDDATEARVLEQTQKAREAEEVAQQRLETLELQRQADVTDRAKNRKVDANAVRQEDAERQRRFAEQQAGVDKPKKEWKLPMEVGSGSREEQIDRFRRDCIYHGLAFVQKKYVATAQQIKWEATC